jgi:serine/threonine protein kinase/Tfp pilus assembly protein PilF
VADDLARLKAALTDRYRIDRELGRGAMATVYLAEDVRHHRQVALKVLRPDLSSVLGADRFQREVAIAATLNHPHIIPLYDSGDADGSLYYVMPYVKGESLRVKLDRDKQLSIDESLAVTRDVAAALDYAHGRDVIHRDVKPENILLHEGEAMVADFGIALVSSATADRLTQTGFVMGTLDYMSPEQAMNERTLDARSDVYSLGCVLYEMLAGTPPYDGPNARARLAKRMLEPVPAVRRIRPEVSAAVDHALTKALATDPVDRFATASAFADALTAPAPATTPAVAVLPFLNLSADPENEYFADGITEDVIAQLSKIRALNVIARTSVMRFKTRDQSSKEIGLILGATTLLDGSVRRAGDRVRIVAKLIDARSDRHLWTDTYDRKLTDIFAIQTDVALQIAAALKTELSVDERARIRKEPTQDVQAYQLYLQGRWWFAKYSGPGMQKAIAYFERAIAMDPGYALAYANMAVAYIELAETGALPPKTARDHAKDAAEHALRLDPTLGEAHSTLAYLHAWNFDWAAAEREFARALELSPNSADTHDLYGRMCSGLGRYDDAIRLERRAQELDPLAHPLDLFTTFIRAGRYDEAAQGAERALEFDPALSRAHATLGWAHIKRGMVDLGLVELELAAAGSVDDSQWIAQLGQAYGLAGRTDEARQILRQLEDRAPATYVSPYHLAFVYTGLGDHERALDLLERAVIERAGAFYGIKGSFLFEPLRSHPRFRRLLKTMNLA